MCINKDIEEWWWSMLRSGRIRAVLVTRYASLLKRLAQHVRRAGATHQQVPFYCYTQHQGNSIKPISVSENDDKNDLRISLHGCILICLELRHGRILFVV